MKLAVITNDKHISSFVSNDLQHVFTQLSHSGHNICVLNDAPTVEMLDQLAQEGFELIYLSDLIKKSILNAPPQFSDIIQREETSIDQENLISFYQDKIVFVTGGEGFIGSEIVAHLLKLPIKKVIVYGHGESSASTLCKVYGHDTRFELILGDIRDIPKLQKSIYDHSPSVVFHAAAHKHVPILEQYPEEAIKTNILGTVNVIKASINASVEQFVLVSTDKAVNPLSVLGASKRIAEKICLAMDEFTPNMRLTTVRFGNVFGSIGSVVPIFLEQIAYTQPLTITDPMMLRYFMSVQEAALLVLLAATTTEGNLFSVDMGAPIAIGELAQKLVEYTGFYFDPKDVQVIGNRGGEKDYEELIYSFEKVLSSQYDKLFVLKNTDPSWTQEEVQGLCDLLSEAALHSSREEMIALLKKYIP